MLSKNQTKRITSLKLKKYREKENAFVVEGKKGVQEFLNSEYELEALYCTDTKFAESLDATIQKKVFVVGVEALAKASFLTQPQEALAVFKIRPAAAFVRNGITVVLDNIRDPGNLGTIIRLCDWFGIAQLVCSEATVDCYNPKVVQASMGSLSRVAVCYTSLSSYLGNDQRPIFGTFLEGEPIHNLTTIEDAVLIMGNEANGISPSIEKNIHKKITIPKFGDLQQTESLNVATATAICLYEFFRST